MSDVSRRIAAAFRDPRALCAALGIDRGSKRLGRRGLQILCVWHKEKTPSLDVIIGQKRAVFAHCWGCSANSDALGLIAAARSLDVKSQYRLVLETACEIGGLYNELAELRGESWPSEPRPVAPAADLPIARAYPPQDELLRFWSACRELSWDGAATGLLAGRGVDPDIVEKLDLARVVPDDCSPPWATYQRRSWLDTGHRLILPVYDAQGDMRSVRAWRVLKGEDYKAPLWDSPPPKRLPPAGFRASELVLANKVGLCMLRGEPVVGRVTLTEGEPDFLTRSVLNSDCATIGILSGSWSAEFAKRIPYGGEVLVRTHRDRAGDGYALKVLESVRGRAQVYRLSIDQEDAA